MYKVRRQETHIGENIHHCSRLLYTFPTLTQSRVLALISTCPTTSQPYTVYCSLGTSQHSYSDTISCLDTNLEDIVLNLHGW